MSQRICLGQNYCEWIYAKQKDIYECWSTSFEIVLRNHNIEKNNYDIFKEFFSCCELYYPSRLSTLTQMEEILEGKTVNGSDGDLKSLSVKAYYNKPTKFQIMYELSNNNPLIILCVAGIEMLHTKVITNVIVKSNYFFDKVESIHVIDPELGHMDLDPNQLLPNIKGFLTIHIF